MIYPKGQTNYYFLLHCNTLGQVMYPLGQLIIYNTTPIDPYGYLTYPLVQLTYPFVLDVYPLVYTRYIHSYSPTIPYDTPILSGSPVGKYGQATYTKPILHPENKPVQCVFGLSSTHPTRPIGSPYLDTICTLFTLYLFYFRSSFDHLVKRTNIEQNTNFYPKQSIDMRTSILWYSLPYP